MDYADFREKRNVNAIDVPEPELFIEEGPPAFPVANATQKSLVDCRTSTLESVARRALPDYPLREIPFPPDPGKAPPPTPRDPRRGKVIHLRTPLRNMAAAKGAVGVTINVGAAFAQCSSKRKSTSLAQSTKISKALPVFGMPSPTEHNNRFSQGNHKRSRKQLNFPQLIAVFECACGANSMLGRVHAELKVHVRLSKDALNVQDPCIAKQLHSQLRDPAEKHLWVSLPCTSGCLWHRVCDVRVASLF